MRAKATAPMRRQPQVTSLSSNQPSRQSRETVSVGWKPGEVDTRQVQDDDPMVGVVLTYILIPIISLN